MKQGSFFKKVVVAVVSLLGLLGLFALFALALLRPQAPQSGSADSALHLMAGLDASLSVRQPLPAGGTLMGRSIAALAKLGARLDQSRDRLTVFRVERETREFYDDLAPRSRDKFQYLLIGETKTPPVRSGTFPAKFWTLTAQRAIGSEVPVAVVFFTDADNDNLSPEALREIERAAQRLAANPRVVDVSIYGAHPKNWAKLRQCFKTLGKRFHLHAAGEMSVSSLLERLATARHQTGQHQTGQHQTGQSAAHNQRRAGR